MKSHEPSARSRLACLGEPSRFALVQTLSQGERCVTDLAHAVGLSQPCTTRHLQALVREGLVRGRRDGKRVVFALRSDVATVRLLLEWALSHPVELAAASRPARGAKNAAAVPGNGARAHLPQGAYAEVRSSIPAPFGRRLRPGGRAGGEAPSTGGSHRDVPTPAMAETSDPSAPPPSTASPQLLHEEVDDRDGQEVPPSRRFEELEDFLL